MPVATASVSVAASACSAVIRRASRPADPHRRIAQPLYLGRRSRGQIPLGVMGPDRAECIWCRAAAHRWSPCPVSVPFGQQKRTRRGAATDADYTDFGVVDLTCSALTAELANCLSEKSPAVHPPPGELPAERIYG